MSINDCTCNKAECHEYQIGGVRKRMIHTQGKEGEEVSTTYKLIHECELFKARLKFYLNHRAQKPDERSNTD